MVTKQLTDMPTHGLVSWLTRQLTDWTARRLVKPWPVNSQTGQLADDTGNLKW